MSVFSSIASYWYGPETETVLSFYNDQTTIYVNVNLELMKSQTKQFEEKKVLTSRKVLNPNNYKDFFTYVGDEKTIITHTQQCIFHKYAKEYEMHNIATKLESQIRSLSIDDIMEIYKINKFIEIDEVIQEFMKKEVMKNMTKFSDPKYFSYVDDELLDILVTREDYEYDSEKNFGLENLLLLLIIRYFTRLAKNDGFTEPFYESVEFSDKYRANFIKFINKIHFDAIKLDALLWIVETICYKDSVLRKEISVKIVSRIPKVLSTITNRKERHILWHMEKIKNMKPEIKLERASGKVIQTSKGDRELLSDDETKALKIGDILDVRDLFSTWFIGKITSIVDNIYTITFDGWTDKFDAQYYCVGSSNKLTENNFAKLGTFTNGIIHDNRDTSIQYYCHYCDKTDGIYISEKVCEICGHNMIPISRPINCKCTTCLFKRRKGQRRDPSFAWM
jgi:hypothetical protein